MLSVLQIGIPTLSSSIFLHYTPAKLSKMGLGDRAVCPRCMEESASFLHMFWDCPVLVPFWTDLFELLNTHFGFLAPKVPLVGLLGVLDAFVPKTHNRSMFRLIFFYAKKAILLRWKDRSPPTLPYLCSLINKMLPMYKVIYKGRACEKKFTKIWQVWLDNSASQQDEGIPSSANAGN